MQRLGLFLLCLVLFSCDFSKTQSENKQRLIKEEMQRINWDEIDRFPLFEDCDETAPKTIQRECFQKEFVKHFYETLQKENLMVIHDVNDTVQVQLLVDLEGKVSIVAVNKNEKVRKELPQLDSLVYTTVNTLPKVYPALKRDIPVSTRMVLPIILRVESQ